MWFNFLFCVDIEEVVEASPGGSPECILMGEIELRFHL